MGLFGSIKDVYKMQSEARQMQKKLKKIKISGVSKSQKVEVIMDGTQEVAEVGIDDALMDVSQKTKLEQEIIEALKDAQKKLQKEMMNNIDLGQLKNMLG